MDTFVNLQLTRAEFHNLVRLVGHHTCGEGMEGVYTKLKELRELEFMIAENKGPLCRDHPIAAQDLYGDRPLVRVEKTYE